MIAANGKAITLNMNAPINLAMFTSARPGTSKFPKRSSGNPKRTAIGAAKPNTPTNAGITTNSSTIRPATGSKIAAAVAINVCIELATIPSPTRVKPIRSVPILTAPNAKSFAMWSNKRIARNGAAKVNKVTGMKAKTRFPRSTRTANGPKATAIKLPVVTAVLIANPPASMANLSPGKTTEIPRTKVVMIKPIAVINSRNFLKAHPATGISANKTIAIFTRSGEARKIGSAIAVNSRKITSFAISTMKPMVNLFKKNKAPTINANKTRTPAKPITKPVTKIIGNKIKLAITRTGTTTSARPPKIINGAAMKTVGPAIKSATARPPRNDVAGTTNSSPMKTANGITMWFSNRVNPTTPSAKPIATKVALAKPDRVS
ncbi:hypothetical protein FC96_GL002388 [Secundilactobacillus kimchicus JCM 15530]|uniref:Uncharacterized protein n=1 Tax=Secundilactobacillus kimchicus JCM 15530 TaxID=1302272 RepID=A0A0R1HMM8_9LACO|nr:hypothetical protein FC96_GL002388 [Secundilactobacillus kimchicus JCM 15530]